ncbi:MAG: NADH-quinone oxidoreductase subunit NuoK [Verrucomicrobiae bacterium]|nr:NADH-quinone oxidoreductase subunit NuoK [Verrucomicrobiae bacterium]
MTLTLGHYLGLSAILFAIGLAGALTRRNAINVLMSIEIMFNAGILNLIAAWHFRYFESLTPQLFAVFAVTIAAAESALGLALVIAVYRHYRSVNVEEMTALRG